MKKTQSGFTLIELMIVVAIIGILAAVAIPQYQNYIARSQVSRVVGEISALKTATEEKLMRGDYPGADGTDLGYTTSNLISGLAVSFPAAGLGAGTIIATLGTDASAGITGGTVTLTRVVTGSWTCATAKAGATLDVTTFAPAGC